MRKALGGHEIATVQTTAIDKEAGLIRLTTTLAHSSGEWLSSEWPVCAISETAAPRRMGAALTYARRYALFTLVGIAGEDDLDAPDLNAKVEVAPKFEPAAAEGFIQPAAEQRSRAAPTQGGTPAIRNSSRRLANPARALLHAELSASVREQLIAEIAQLQTEDEAADWVHRNLPVKNTLLAADADIVEADFRNRLAVIESAQSASAMLSQAIAGDVDAERRRIDRGPLLRPQGKFNRIAGRPAWDDQRQRASSQAEDHSPARQGALQVRHDPALPRLRPNPNRSPSYPLCPTPRARPQSERRVHGPGLPAPPPRTASLWRRGLVVGRRQHRPVADRA